MRHLTSVPHCAAVPMCVRSMKDRPSHSAFRTQPKPLGLQRPPPRTAIQTGAPT
jgi:hypothetical protein